MRLKERPEDFIVEEVSRYDPSDTGRVAVYDLKKRDLDTFEAVRRLARRLGIPPARIHTLGLKDKRALTTQLVGIEGGPAGAISLPEITCRYLGRGELPFAELLGNAFRVIVRDLRPREIEAARARMPGLVKHGLVNYFDAQRFSLPPDQLPGRDLVRGDHEAAVRRMLAATASRRGKNGSEQARLLSRHWRKFDALARHWGNRPGAAMVRHLEKRPGDFTGALARLPGRERAMYIFAYQSLIWNRCVTRFLEARIPESSRMVLPHITGPLIQLDCGPEEEAPTMPDTFPLLDPTVHPEDLAMRDAISRTLAEEGLTIEKFQVQGIPGCFLKHEERPLRVFPKSLDMAPPRRDPARRGRRTALVRFQLPPGAYATLLLTTLFSEGRS